MPWLGGGFSVCLSDLVAVCGASPLFLPALPWSVCLADSGVLEAPPVIVKLFCPSVFQRLLGVSEFIFVGL